MKQRDAIDAILQQSNLIGCIISPLQCRANAVPVAGSKKGAESKCWAREHASSGIPRRCSRKQDLPASQWGREARLCSQANEIQITRLKLHAQNNTLKCGGVRDLHAFQSASAIPRALRKHGRWSVIDDEKNCLTVSLLFQPSLLSLLVCKGSGMSAVGYYGPFLHMPMQ